MSATMKLAKKICEFCDVGQPTAARLLKCVLPGEGWLHGECLQDVFGSLLVPNCALQESLKTSSMA